MNPAKGHPDARRMWWTLFAMCFALFMIMLDNTVVNVALPSIQRELQATPSTLEWTVNAYVLTFATLILLGGKLGDRFGRRRLFLVGLIVFTVASALCALSTSDTQLIAARAFQGVGAAIMNPLSLSILVATFPRERLAAAIGIWAGISGLGLAVGPLLGGFLVEHVGWSSVFWINVPIGVVAAAVLLWKVAESRDTRTKSLDIVGTVLVTSGLFALTFGLIETNSRSWLSPEILALLGGSLVLLVGFILWELHTPEPMVPLGFFRKRAFLVASLVVGLVGLALFGSIYFITLYFQNIQGYSAIEAGLRTLPTTLMILVVAPLAGRLNARVGSGPMMLVGMLMASTALFGLAQMDVDTSYNAIWPFFVLLGAGLALTMPSVSAMAMSSVDPTRSGVASGVVNASRQVGGAIGIAVLGSITAKVALDNWLSSSVGSSAGAGQTVQDLVVGGQVQLIEQSAGPEAGATAADSFVQGMQASMYVGAVLCLIAAALAATVLRVRPAQAHAPATAAESPAAAAALEV
jgi:EmrB/QacA subfamily drug resistance transporter